MNSEVQHYRHLLPVYLSLETLSVIGVGMGLGGGGQVQILAQ